MKRGELIWDLVFGAVLAGLAYGVHAWTGEAWLTLGLIAFISLIFIWFRSRGQPDPGDGKASGGG